MTSAPSPQSEATEQVQQAGCRAAGDSQSCPLACTPLCGPLSTIPLKQGELTFFKLLYSCFLLWNTQTPSEWSSGGSDSLFPVEMVDPYCRVLEAPSSWRQPAFPECLSSCRSKTTRSPARPRCFEDTCQDCTGLHAPAYRTKPKGSLSPQEGGGPRLQASFYPVCALRRQR